MGLNFLYRAVRGFSCDNYLCAEDIVAKYSQDIDDKLKKRVKLDIAKIFGLIEKYKLKEEEILPNIHQLVLNNRFELIREYYKDLFNRSYKYKN